MSVPLGSSATGNADNSTTSRPLTPHDQPLMLTAGITKMAHLQIAYSSSTYQPASGQCSDQCPTLASYCCGSPDSSYLAARPFSIRQPAPSEHSNRSKSISRLALTSISSMIRHDRLKCNDAVRQISGVCSSWLRGRDPSMTLLFSFVFGLQDSCPFLSSKRAFRTPDEPEVRRNNGLMCMQ